MPDLRVVEHPSVKSDETIAALEDTLAMARDGKLVSVMLIGEAKDGSRYTRYTACRDLFALLGEVERLAYRINRRMDDATTTGGPT